MTTYTHFQPVSGSTFRGVKAQLLRVADNGNGIPEVFTAQFGWQPFVESPPLTTADLPASNPKKFLDDLINKQELLFEDHKHELDPSLDLDYLYGLYREWPAADPDLSRADFKSAVVKKYPQTLIAGVGWRVSGLHLTPKGVAARIASAEAARKSFDAGRGLSTTD